MTSRTSRRCWKLTARAHEPPETHSAANVEEARHLLEQFRFDLCLTDMRLPDGNGIGLVKHIPGELSADAGSGDHRLRQHGDRRFAALKGRGVRFPIQAARSQRSAQHRALRAQVPRPAEDVAATPNDPSPVGEKMLGDSPAIHKVRAAVENSRAARRRFTSAANPAPARSWRSASCTNSARAPTNPLFRLIAGAIPENLMESEFSATGKAVSPAPSRTRRVCSRPPTAPFVSRRGRRLAAVHAGEAAAGDSGKIHPPGLYQAEIKVDIARPERDPQETCTNSWRAGISGGTCPIGSMSLSCRCRACGARPRISPSWPGNSCPARRRTRHAATAPDGRDHETAQALSLPGQRA